MKNSTTLSLVLKIQISQVGMQIENCQGHTFSNHGNTNKVKVIIFQNQNASVKLHFFKASEENRQCHDNVMVT